ncbi:MAG: FHA domain-containing protein, partial [Planctomycetes bacterium]|nr:FHA domain-containing protein [Planctomycetota bacterium]
MSQHSITIIEPNGVQRSRPLTTRGLTIGRGTDNDLVINYNNVSRHHAQILFDNGYYYVLDLNSANGAYLGNVRLAPNEPTLWRPGTPLG